MNRYAFKYISLNAIQERKKGWCDRVQMKLQKNLKKVQPAVLVCPSVDEDLDRLSVVSFSFE